MLEVRARLLLIKIWEISGFSVAFVRCLYQERPAALPQVLLT